MAQANLAQNRVHRRHFVGPDAKVDIPAGSQQIGVPLIGCDLASGHQEDFVEPGLQLALLIVMRLGIVIGDRDEIESARGR